MAVEGAVRVHVRHQVQVGAGQQFIQHRVVVFFQAFDHAFHEPLGHVFAGMLLGNDPHLAPAFGARAFAQQRDVPAFDALAGGQQFGAGLGQCLLDQPVMAATAVGFEVGKPGVGAVASRLKRRQSPSKMVGTRNQLTWS